MEILDFFNSLEVAKRLHAKIYEEAKRLKVKWILGGECGHMWRVWHQYHNTWFGPIDFLEVPNSPITGTVFEHAKSNKIVHNRVYSGFNCSQQVKIRSFKK